MLNWREISRDPNDAAVRKELLKYLLKIRKYGCSFDQLVKERMAGKRVLDIGVVEHTLSYIQKDGWKHAIIHKHAFYLLGVDILEEEVSTLNTMGYNVKVSDATSDEFLGEYFDVVFIGDVIEHVNDPVKLIKYAQRHLSDNGVILVSTPNPLNLFSLISLFKNRISIANAEHVNFITPCNMNEICYRANVTFKNYYVATKGHKNFFKNILKHIFPIEFITGTFLYELEKSASNEI